ncbi:Zinc carboxypeptidase A 1 [Orchesella cincta]|uniref:Zinc carboxypeptidase A 1 n=1 Tax=Orchesella cincta TaxID=48709 RepID=A0A1D2M5E4_ORCCI|nr:Zinc carboxypeptidase A 1 [Orchesella cincta]
MINRWIPFLCLLALPSSTLSKKVLYDNWKLYRFYPCNAGEMSLLLDLHESNLNIIFLQDLNRHMMNMQEQFMSVDILLSPNYLMSDTFKTLKDKIESHVLAENVQKLIDEEAKHIVESGSSLNWDSYGSIGLINQFLGQMAAKYTHVDLLDMGVSAEKGIPLKVLKISSSDSHGKIWISGGLHGRDWISSAVVTYVINELLTSKDVDVNNISEFYDLYFLPVMNPDGYDYSQKTDRMWKKTRASTNSNIGCVGADANRNWDDDSKLDDTFPNPCNNTYPGDKGFSENEVVDASEFYMNHVANDTNMFLTVHGYNQLILLPYGRSGGRFKTEDAFDEWVGVAKKAARSMSGHLPRKVEKILLPHEQFRIGNISDIMGERHGSAVDWVTKQNSKIELALEIGLNNLSRGIFVPADQIKQKGIEFMKGLKELVIYFNGKTTTGDGDSPQCLPVEQTIKPSLYCFAGNK